MKIDQSKFINRNYNEFTHQKALQYYLAKVPEFFVEGASNIEDISYDEDEITISYYDKDDILQKVTYPLVGPTGIKGETGDKGPQGPPGDRGPTDLSAVHDYHAVYSNLNPTIIASSKPGTNHFLVINNIPLNNDFHYLFYIKNGIKPYEHLLDLQFVDNNNQVLDLSNSRLYGNLVLVYRGYTGTQTAIQAKKEVFYLDMQYNNNTVSISNLNVDIPHYTKENPLIPDPINLPGNQYYYLYPFPYEIQFFIDLDYANHSHTIT